MKHDLVCKSGTLQHDDTGVLGKVTNRVRYRSGRVEYEHATAGASKL